MSRSFQISRSFPAVVCLTLSLTQARGASPLYPNQVIPIGGEPFSVATGDFNRDGRRDLAIVNIESKDVSILLGRGDSTFGPDIRFPVGDAPYAVAVGDFDRDGRQDLAIVNALSNDVSILMGRGDGTFAPQARFAAGDFPTSVAVGDFDRDGAQDLAVTDAFFQSPGGAGRVGVLPGRGDGTFGPERGFDVGPGADFVAVSDLDGDGNQDLTTANALSSDVSILLGRGDGRFEAEARFGVGDGPVFIAATDLDGDGAPDLAVANRNSGDVSILFSRGHGTFAPEIRLILPVDYLALPTSIGIGDFNSDGRMDLSVSGDQSDVWVLLGVGAGVFGTPIGLTVDGSPNSIAVADLDGDHVLDLAVANGLGNSVSILVGTRDGSFAPQKRYPVGAHPSSLTTGDLNRDGRPDLVVASYESSEVSILLGSDDGTFAPPISTATGDGALAAAVGDFDVDGLPDLAVVGSGGLYYVPGNVDILLGAGDGSLRFVQAYPVQGAPSSVAVSDMNADGRMDLVVTNEGTSYLPSGVSVLLGRGDGTFGPQTSFPAGDRPASLAVGDVNGDGHPDVIVANVNAQTVSVLLGRGDGTLGPPSPFEAGVFPGSVALGDFDGNGFPDLVVSNGGSDDVSVLLGLGDGTFREQLRFPAGIDVSQPEAADLDADGRQDLVVLNGFSGDVSVLLGHGDGTFGPQDRFAIGAFANSLVVGDFNADGLPDLAATNWVAGDVRLLFHTGRTPDRDGDGISDEADNCPRIANPRQEDADLDRVGDACDNCPEAYNPDQIDSDGNGIGEACEQKIVDIRISFGSGRGSGTVTWRTTHELRVSGFNVITYDSKGTRVQYNATLIPCKQCVTGAGASYTFIVPKHKSGKGIFIEGICPEDCLGPYGPAVRQLHDGSPEIQVRDPRGRRVPPGPRGSAGPGP